MATKLRCIHCAREWFPRTAKPVKCPGCQRRDYAQKLPRLLDYRKPKQ